MNKSFSSITSIVKIYSPYSLVIFGFDPHLEELPGLSKNKTVYKGESIMIKCNKNIHFERKIGVGGEVLEGKTFVSEVCSG